MHPVETLTDEELIELGRSVAEIAADIFADCGSPADFCIQHNAGDSIVFGGSNRLTLSARGWKASLIHCSPKFLTRCKVITT